MKMRGWNVTVEHSERSCYVDCDRTQMMRFFTKKRRKKQLKLAGNEGRNYADDGKTRK